MTRLGELESAAMQVVWSAPEPVTAREVADALAGRQLAYTTVLTVLTRLEGKGLVRRECLDHALTSREPYGVWGGMTEAQREELLYGPRPVRIR